MINFNHYDGDSFQLFHEAVGRKGNGDAKIALQNIEDKVKGSYETYQKAFENKQVHLLTQTDLYLPNEQQLLKYLY